MEFVYIVTEKKVAENMHRHNFSQHKKMIRGMILQWIKQFHESIFSLDI
jgi:hypothetical protein